MPKNNVLDHRIYNNDAKVGATAGWTVRDATDIGTLGLLPASQTDSTLVVPITGLKVGDTIEGYYLLGQLESAGGDVTIIANLRKLTAAAADNTDASVETVTLSHTAATDLILNSTTIVKNGLTEVVAEGETFYMLITGTTAGSTDVALTAVVVKVRSVYHK